MSEELFERYLKNELDEAGARRLSGILATEEGARAFSEFVQEWTLLGEVALQRVAQANRQGTRKIRKTSSPAAPPRAWLAWAAGLAAVAIFGLLILSPGRVPREEGSVTRVAPMKPAPVEPPLPDPPKPLQAEVPASEPERVGPPAPQPTPPTNVNPAAPGPAPLPVEPVREKAAENRPSEPSKVARALVAVFGGIQGSVLVTSASGPRKAVSGDGLVADEGLESAQGAHALLEFPDGSRVDLGPNSSIDRISERQGRRSLALARGTLSATVAKQAAGRSLAVTTAQGEALVLGTQFTVTAAADSSRLEVREGRVRWTRPDGVMVEVTAGHFSVAAKGQKLESKPILFTREFQEGAGYAGMRDTSISGADPNRSFGSDEVLEVDGDEVEGKKIYGLLRWDLSELPPGAVLRSAVITLFVVNESQGSGYSFYEMKRPWSEAEATWRQAAAQQPWRAAGARSTSERGSEALGTVAPRAKGEIRVLVLPAGEALIQSWIRLPASNHGMILANDSNADGFKFSSRESAIHDRRPKLTLTYTLSK